jgi:hypothetical protein
MFGVKKSQEYSKQHSEELRKFNVALEALNGYQFENNKLPDYELLLENIARLKNTLMEKDNAVKNSADQIGKLTAIKKAFEEYLQIKNPEKEVEERNQRSDERASGQQRYDDRA